MMTPDSTLVNARHITIDAEHFSVRFLVPVLTLLATVIFHFGTMWLLDAIVGEGVNVQCIVLPLDIVVLLSAGYGVERILKRALPSRRSALLSDETLVVTDGRRTPPAVQHLTWTKTVNVLAWRFEVKRRTRVPKGWHCMAIQLLQDEVEVVLYTFMPPKTAEDLPGYTNFVRLRPRKETESNTDLRAIAEQRRLLRLEDTRWEDGAEIAIEDFKAVLARLGQHVPGWR